MLYNIFSDLVSEIFLYNKTPCPSRQGVLYIVLFLSQQSDLFIHSHSHYVEYPTDAEQSQSQYPKHSDEDHHRIVTVAHYSVHALPNRV